MNDADLIAFAETWQRGDPDPVTSKWLRERILEEDFASLRLAFSHPLSFGTAGLRGPVGPGPAAMNLATVSRVSFGLGKWLSNEQGVVVVGFDARPDSQRFARRAAEVLSGFSLRVLLAERPVATPLVGFAVRSRGALAGVVVTASHNPRGDNGYKVFDDQGVQIVAPWDECIAASMTQAPPANEMPFQERLVEALPESIVSEYLDQVCAVATKWGGKATVDDLSLAYTPLHGVGFEYVRSALGCLPKMPLLHVVDSQRDPDGTFPTVAFPNPEESGALVQLLALAEEKGCSAALANDPDADRFSLCLRHRGEMVCLSGDAVGLLFADACLTEAGGGSVVSTVVSSPALEPLVAARGGRVVRTLTGFKWLCRAALLQEDFVFAYEEALGYCFAAPPGVPTVMDKDGVAALCVAVQLLARHGNGEGLFRHLLCLYEEVGFWGSHGRSLRLSGANSARVMASAMMQVRNAAPETLAGFRWRDPQDFARDADQRPAFLGAQDLLSFELDAEEVTSSGPSHGRILLRPSGTEPKLKAYIHLCSPFSKESDYLENLEHQESVADAIFAEFLKFLDERLAGSGFASRQD